MIHNVTAGELIREVLIAGIIPAVIETLKNGGKKAGEVLGEKAAKSLEESRAELLAYIQSLEAEDPGAAETLIRRQQDRQFLMRRAYGAGEPYESGDENRYVQLLTKFYRALDKPEQAEMRKETFKWLAHLSDERFDAMLEFLHDDRAIQWLKRAGAGIGQIAEAVTDELDDVNNGWADRLNDIRTRRGLGRI